MLICDLFEPSLRNGGRLLQEALLRESCNLLLFDLHRLPPPCHVLRRDPIRIIEETAARNSSFRGKLRLRSIVTESPVVILVLLRLNGALSSADASSRCAHMNIRHLLINTELGMDIE